MSMINYASREINCKIVYYGTGLGGKTTNLEYIYSRVNPDTRFHLYTVPGQVCYNASRLLILKGVDGLVFVGDSQANRAEANIESMHNLYENLETYGYDLETIPFAISTTTSETCRTCCLQRSSVPRSTRWGCRISRVSRSKGKGSLRPCRA